MRGRPGGSCGGRAGCFEGHRKEKATMPIFEYACHSCQHEFEMLVPSHTTKVACPKCQGGDVEKRFSAFAVRAVGGGTGPVPAAGMSGGGGGCCGGG